MADSGNNRIQKLDGQGHFITKWGSRGSKDGQFSCNFCGVAVDGHDDVYVTDTDNSRVQKFDGNGKFLTKWGSFGIGNGQFKSPFGVAVDRQGNVYIGDAGKAKWGGLGVGDGRFSGDLADIAVDARGNIYVSDRSKDIQKFDSNRNFVVKFETCGDRKLISSTTGVAVDTQGDIYVSDLSDSRICKYDNSGRFLTAWGGFYRSVGFIAVDQQDDIYVAELFANLVQQFHQG